MESKYPAKRVACGGMVRRVGVLIIKGAKYGLLLGVFGGLFGVCSHRSHIKQTVRENSLRMKTIVSILKRRQDCQDKGGSWVTHIKQGVFGVYEEWDCIEGVGTQF